MLINSILNYATSGFKNVDEKIKLDRLNICKSCEYFNESLHQCRHCGCFLQIKTSWASEKCPIDKWNSEIEVKNQELTQFLPPSGDCGCNKK